MGFEPSEPQLVMGEAIKTKLPEFENSLKPLPAVVIAPSTAASATSDAHTLSSHQLHK